MAFFYSFWAINGPLNSVRLCRQIDQFCEAGLDGIVFHPRFYPNDPSYLSEQYLAQVSDAILYAKSVGLKFWIYDEDGWPSGTAGGQLLRLHPDDAQRWVGLTTEKPERFISEFEHGGKRWFFFEQKGGGVDYLNPDLARHFVALTHERYRTGLTPEAFDHVEAFFCDEPEFGLGHAFDGLPRHGAIPWTSRLPELFRNRFGEELIPRLPLLFFPGEGYREFRILFWELLNELFCNAFLSPLDEWCQQHGKLFTAHIKGEEHPLFQVPLVGSCHRVFQNLSLPGIDALERYPSNHFFPRQVSSAARQFGNGRCMVEAFGGSGWGGTPEDLERYLMWLGMHGLTDFVLHLSQYRLDSAAILDWPPSQPLHLSWKSVYPHVLNKVRRELEQQLRPAADLLVVAPYRGIMAEYQPRELLDTNIHNASTYPDSPAATVNGKFMETVEALHRAGVNYDITDERTLDERAELADGGVKLGNCRYRNVLVADGCLLGPATVVPARASISVNDAIGQGVLERPIEVASPNGFCARVEWTLESHPQNDLFLECKAEADWMVAHFSNDYFPASSEPLELIFADDVVEAILNGCELKSKSSDEGSRAFVPARQLKGNNELSFRLAKPGEKPFVWLRGLFRVQCGSPFSSGPGEMIATEGPFAISPANSLISPDLLETGFPFLRSGLSVVTLIDVPSEAVGIQLRGAIADAVHLTVDGEDFGWNWNALGGFQYDVTLSAGLHRVKLELIPNGYNFYGPHHYYLGDSHVVSPDQIKGVRNFADPENAPANTHVGTWYFRRFQLPGEIAFISLPK